MQHIDPRHLVERALPQDDRVKGSRAARTATVNLSESPLSWLHSRGHLSDRQLLAGEKLREDFEAAAMGPQVTMQWDTPTLGRQKRGSHEPLAQSERMIMAKQRFDTALRALGNDLSDIAWRVICGGEAISGAERTLGWPQRSGKLVLRIALDRLAYHYRLPG
ncbi:MAG: DUF6456 domain-containing protein [Sphingorhabdus sp.]